jgi:hypothetical protein
MQVTGHWDEGLGFRNSPIRRFRGKVWCGGFGEQGEVCRIYTGRRV